MTRHPGGASATQKLISAAAPAPGARIIDLGAGDGDAVRALRALGYETVGLDLNPGPDVERGDILAPPFEPESFDAALSQCAFLLTGDVPGALASARRLLKPGGILMYSDAVPGGVAALPARGPRHSIRATRPSCPPSAAAQIPPPAPGRRAPPPRRGRRRST